MKAQDWPQIVWPDSSLGLRVPNKHEALGSILSSTLTDCGSTTLLCEHYRVRDRKIRQYQQSGPHREFEASLSCMRDCLKTNSRNLLRMIQEGFSNCISYRYSITTYSVRTFELPSSAGAWCQHWCLVPWQEWFALNLAQFPKQTPLQFFCHLQKDCSFCLLLWVNYY